MNPVRRNWGEKSKLDVIQKKKKYSHKVLKNLNKRVIIDDNTKIVKTVLRNIVLDQKKNDKNIFKFLLITSTSEFLVHSCQKR